MGFFSSVKSFIKEAASTVKRAAGKVIEWMAEKGEAFIGGVKKVWRAVEPYVGKVQAVLAAAAKATSSIPWLSAAITAVNTGITALTTFANSPIAKKIEKALKFAIELAKRWQEGKEKAGAEMEDGELEEARRHQETFRIAEGESASKEERHMLELMGAINDYSVAKGDLARALEGVPKDFEHYLRLRATQKLLCMSGKRFQDAKSIDDLDTNDLFLVRIASDLVKSNPELNARAAERLDRVLDDKYNKKLASFVYEELVASWKKEAAALEEDLDKENSQLSKNTVLLRRLTADKKIQNELSVEDFDMLEKLEKEVPRQEAEVERKHRQQMDVECYANAAEGFLQLIEKSEEQLEEEDLGYVVEDGEDVGRIILQVAENKIPFSALSMEDQSLILDFANAFRADANSRMKEILEMTA